MKVELRGGDGERDTMEFPIDEQLASLLADVTRMADGVENIEQLLITVRDHDPPARRGVGLYDECRAVEKLREAIHSAHRQRLDAVVVKVELLDMLARLLARRGLW